MLSTHAAVHNTFNLSAAIWSRVQTLRIFRGESGGPMEKCGWRRVIVYYDWGSFCSVAINLMIPSSPLIGIAVSSGRGLWRAYTGAPALSRQSGEAVGAPFLAADAVMHEE
jgi:hypothetical protein